VYIFLLGILYGFLTIESKSITPAIISHSLFNTMVRVFSNLH
jgi:membrane protease YdiL (CAAX protease family)